MESARPFGEDDLENTNQPELFSVDPSARLFGWPGFENNIKERKYSMVVELLAQLIQLAKGLKPTDRGEKARQYSILITELEKIIAYAKEYQL